MSRPVRWLPTRRLEHLEKVVRALRLVLQHELLEFDQNSISTRCNDECDAINVVRIEARKARARERSLHLVTGEIHGLVAVLHVGAPQRLCCSICGGKSEEMEM